MLRPRQQLRQQPRQKLKLQRLLQPLTRARLTLQLKTRQRRKLLPRLLRPKQPHRQVAQPTLRRLMVTPVQLLARVRKQRLHPMQQMQPLAVAPPTRVVTPQRVLLLLTQQ